MQKFPVELSLLRNSNRHLTFSFPAQLTVIHAISRNVITAFSEVCSHGYHIILERSKASASWKQVE